MAALLSPGEGIVTLVAGETMTFRKAPRIEHLVVRGTAAGSFVLQLGNTQIIVTNSASDLTLYLPVNRRLNTLELTSGPTGATVYAFLTKK